MIPNPFDNPLVRDIAFYCSAGFILVFCLICLGVEIYKDWKAKRISKNKSVM